MINYEKLRNILLVVALVIVTLASEALGAESEAASWRPVYDTIMLWVNFLILAFALYKLLRKPLSDFIAGQKVTIEKDLNKAEADKQKAEDKIRETKEMIEKGEEKYVRLKEMIIAEGTRRKEKIIQEAEEQSKLMMQEAKRKIDSKFYRAQRNLKNEMIDMAFELAEERLQKAITDDDNQKLFKRFLEASEKAA